MKIKQIFFGTAVRFKGKVESYIDADASRVTITFGNGVITVKDNDGAYGPTCVFTTNVKYFHPESESATEKTVAEKPGQAPNAPGLTPGLMGSVLAPAPVVGVMGITVGSNTASSAQVKSSTRKRGQVNNDPF